MSTPNSRMLILALLVLFGTIKDPVLAEETIQNNMPAIKAWPGQNQLEKEQAEAITASLQRFREAAPKPSDKVLQIIYFIPSDQKPFPGHVERCDRVMKHIQAFYKKGMQEAGLGPRTFRLQEDSAGKLKMHIVHGKLTRKEYHYRTGQIMRKEIAEALKKKGIDTRNETIVIFQVNIVGTKLDFDEVCPYYGAGNFRGGYGFFIDFELLDSDNLPKLKPITHYRKRRYTLGKLNSVHIGGVAHELGHGLGLPHVRQKRVDAVRGTSLMGSGNYTYGEELRPKEGKGSFLSFSSAVRLASHPLFSRTERERDIRPRFEMLSLNTTQQEKTLSLEGKFFCQPSAYATVVYIDGDKRKQDYDALAWVAIPTLDGSFKLSIPFAKPGSYQVRLVTCMLNGAINTQRYKLTFDSNGKADLTGMQVRSKTEKKPKALAAPSYADRGDLFTKPSFFIFERT